MNDFALILFFFSVLGAGLCVILFAISLTKKNFAICPKKILIILRILVVVISISIVLYGMTQTSYQKDMFER